MKRIITAISALAASFALAATDTTSISITVTNNDVDWCNIQFPERGTNTLGSDFPVFARVYETDSTNGAGQGGGIYSWIGYSEINATSTADFASGWTWVAAIYHGDAYNENSELNNDEYKADLMSSISTPGTYYYVSRFSRDSISYKYGGYSSSGGNFWDGITFISGVLTVNKPIIITHIVDLTLTEDTPDTLILDAAYSNGDLVTGTWSVTGGHADSVLAAVSGDTLFLNPAMNYFGPANIRFIVMMQDGEGTTARDTFYVTSVSAVNDAPEINVIAGQSIQEGQNLSLTLTANDPDGDALSWNTDNVPTGALFTDKGDNTATFVWRPGYTQAGAYNVSFVVSDGSAKSAVVTQISAPVSKKSAR